MAAVIRVHNDGSKDVETVAAWANSEAFHLTLGNQIIDVNTNNSTINMSRIVVGPGFTGVFGTIAAPIIAEVSDVTPTDITKAAFYYRALRGKCAYKPGDGDTKLCDLYHQDGDTLVQLLGGKTLVYELMRGTLEADTAATIAKLIQDGGSSHLKDSGSASASTDIIINGGNCRFERQSSLIDVSSGALILEAKANTQGTVKVTGNGQLDLNESGTIADLIVTGGILVPNISRPLVITNATLDMSIPGVRELWMLKDILVTFSNEPTWQGGYQA